MDEIEFRKSNIKGWVDPVVDIFINGQNLIELVRQQELPFAEAEGYPSIAGGYVGLSFEEVDEVCKLFLYPSRERVAIMRCRDCGEIGCWPLLVHIETSPDSIEWRDFCQPYREEGRSMNPWLYHGFGPFQFARAQYEGALMKLNKNDE